MICNLNSSLINTSNDIETSNVCCWVVNSSNVNQDNSFKNNINKIRNCSYQHKYTKYNPNNCSSNDIPLKTFDFHFCLPSGRNFTIDITNDKYNYLYSLICEILNVIISPLDDPYDKRTKNEKSMYGSMIINNKNLLKLNIINRNILESIINDYTGFKVMFIDENRININELNPHIVANFDDNEIKFSLPNENLNCEIPVDSSKLNNIKFY
jgi:hypothetical protein